MLIHPYHCKYCHRRLVHIQRDMNRCKSRLSSHIFHLWHHRAVNRRIRPHLGKVKNLFTIISQNFYKSLEESVSSLIGNHYWKFHSVREFESENGCVIMVFKWKQQTINNKFNNFYTEKVDSKKCHHPLLI